ncbi:MAG TPA: cobalamin-binding protein [Polyangia bacterium]|nr:cobalamin-binding protein [Polyangia bacterium]
MRVVSLIASATEMVCALGCEDRLVGRSHECDFPPSVKRLPQLTSPKFSLDGSSAQIDERVKELLRSALAVYRVDADRLAELRPDVIVTQSQCDVCAVSLRDVEEAVCGILPSRPRIVSLEPNTLDDVWRDLARVAEALDVRERGAELIARSRARLAEVSARVAGLPRPTVACIEWVEPLMAAGNWMPTLVELAGGRSLFGEAGKHSPWMTFDELAARDPEIIVALPCGYDLARTAEDMPLLARHAEWPKLRAVRDGRVFVTDGNQYFNRPGPRLVDSLEILAEIFHPREFAPAHRGDAWQPWPAPSQSQHAED